MLQNVPVSDEQARMLRAQDWGLITEDERYNMYREKPLEITVTKGQTDYRPLIFGALGLVALMLLFGGNK